MTEDATFVKGNMFHRTDGPAYIRNGRCLWFVNGIAMLTNEQYQTAAKLTDEEMTMLVLKYGNVQFRQ